MAKDSPRVLIVVDDREFTSGELCSLVGVRRFGDIVLKRRPLFEHLFDEGDHILVRDSTVVEISPGKVHSPWLLWDDSRIYGGRPFRGDLRIPDAVRYVAYREMVDFVLERLNLKTSKVGTDKSKEVTIMHPSSYCHWFIVSSVNKQRGKWLRKTQVTPCSQRHLFMKLT